MIALLIPVVLNNADDSAVQKFANKTGQKHLDFTARICALAAPSRCDSLQLSLWDIFTYAQLCICLMSVVIFASILSCLVLFGGITS